MIVKKLIGNRVLAEVIKTENKSASGIILGPTANLDANKAKVTVVGPDEKIVKVGDIIKYDLNTAIEQEIDGKDCVFLRGGPTGNILFRY